MSVAALDTSVVVAALLGWHDAHARALDRLQAASRARIEILLPAPALTESYAVMTRLPSPHRLSPANAMRLLSEGFEERASVISLTGTETWKLLLRLETEGIAGGRTYDALILACARKGGAAQLLTLDAADFLRFEVGDLEIVVP